MPAGGGRQAVLDALRGAAQPVTIAAVAEELGVHQNTVRFHLDTLVANGQAERVAPQRRGPGRPAQLFRAVRVMDPSGPRHYHLLAELLVEALAETSDATERALEVGSAWGRSVPEPTVADEEQPARAVEEVQVLLTDLGFAPERLEADPDSRLDGAEELRIGLRRCPFLELARRAPQIVCPVHLGIVRGATDAWEAPITVTSLEPFAEPDVCVMHLAPRTEER